MIKVKSTHPPAIYTDSLGKRRIAAGTVYEIDGYTPHSAGSKIVLAPHVTPNDFEWTPWPERTPKPSKALPTPKTVEVKGSKPGVTYTVTILPDGRSMCTCPGFTFRRFCKHTGAV